jgi:hypothetical protein
LTGYPSTESHAVAVVEARRLCALLHLDPRNCASTIVRAWGRKLAQDRRVRRRRERVARRVRRQRQ